MTKPKEPRFTRGHIALGALIETKFEGSKVEAARAAVKKDFPVGADGDRYEDQVYQVIVRISNGNIHKPGLDKLLWCEKHWGIPLPLWNKEPK